MARRRWRGAAAVGRARRAVAVITAVAALLVVGPAVTDSAQAVVTSGAAASGRIVLPAAAADQGLTVVGDHGHLLTRGRASVPAGLRRLGWVHVGDPDAAAGLVVDAYQGSADATSKAFAVTYPGGRRTLLVHPLVPGESYHNSFVTISPDRRWLVSGEWGSIDRLLVFPLLTRTRSAPVQTLPLAGSIALGHAVRNVQGCDFASPTTLLCSTNDTTTSLFPVTRQLLSVTLARALRAGATRAAVTLVGSVPDQDVCVGAAGEVEGIDVTGGVVRVAVNAPCSPVTEVFSYPAHAVWRAAGDIDLRTSWSGPPPLVDVVVPRSCRWRTPRTPVSWSTRRIHVPR